MQSPFLHPRADAPSLQLNGPASLPSHLTSPLRRRRVDLKPAARIAFAGNRNASCIHPVINACQRRHAMQALACVQCRSTPGHRQQRVSAKFPLLPRDTGLTEASDDFSPLGNLLMQYPAESSGQSSHTRLRQICTSHRWNGDMPLPLSSFIVIVPHCPALISSINPSSGTLE